MLQREIVIKSGFTSHMLAADSSDKVVQVVIRTWDVIIATPVGSRSDTDISDAQAETALSGHGRSRVDHDAWRERGADWTSS